jgi:hypothetical protein
MSADEHVSIATSVERGERFTNTGDWAEDAAAASLANALEPYLPDERTPPPAPYRGINSFRFIDAPVFFAREADVQRLTRCVTVYRGTLLYGSSGVGKSSLVNAGFMPLALRHGFLPERLRVQPRPGREIVVERIVLGHDGGPPYMPSNLIPQNEPGDRVAFSIDELMTRVQRIPEDKRPLLIFDQFEELVTLFEEAPETNRAGEALAMQEHIIDALVALLTRHTIPVKLLFSFREDYLAKFTKLFQRTPDLPDQYLRLTPPHLSDLPAMIGGPLERFPQQYGGRFPPALVSELVDAFTDRATKDQQLVLTEVQIACWKLWNAPDPAALLHSRDGLQGILELYIGDEIAKFERTDEREAIGAILARLVTKSGARNIVSKDDLVHDMMRETHLSADRLDDLLVQLDGNVTRLVRGERRQDVLYYTIVSEFLVPWIRRWKERRQHQIELQRAEEERKAVEQRLEEERREAARRLELERQQAAMAIVQAKASRMRVYVVAAAIIATILATLSLFAFGQMRQATGLNRTLSFVKDSVINAATGLQDSVRNARSESGQAKGLLDSLAHTNASVQERTAALQAYNQKLVAQLAEQAKALASAKAALEVHAKTDVATQQNQSYYGMPNAQARPTQSPSVAEINDSLERAQRDYVAVLRRVMQSSDKQLASWASDVCRKDVRCAGAAAKY